MKKESIILYLCNPKLHTECKKTHCLLNGGSCLYTRHPEFRVAGTEGISSSELLEEIKEHWIEVHRK